jgi:pimeloyl-ACP methyl ester carboxylesterase
MKNSILIVLIFCALGILHVPGLSQHPEDVIIMSDGLQLHGKLYKSFETGLHPTVLLIHGWPGSPIDVLDMGKRLSGHGLNVLILSPRGMHESEGTNTFAGTLRDIGASLRWLRSPDVSRKYQIDPNNIILGGHSFGGGMALAYAAGDPTIRRLISFAGTDHGELARKYESDESFASMLREIIKNTQAPDGPIRFDFDASFKEIVDNKNIFGLRENANKLADRRILLIGGWEDTSTTVDDFMLPLYRSLKSAGAEEVTFLVYHDGHGFRKVRDRIEEDLLTWINQ